MGTRSVKRAADAAAASAAKRKSPDKEAATGSAQATAVAAAAPVAVLDEEYEVEAILGMRDVKPGQTQQFFVKWKGYDDNQNTWEPREHLTNCPDLVNAFLLDIAQRALATLPSIPSAKLAKTAAAPLGSSPASSRATVSMRASTTQTTQKRVIMKEKGPAPSARLLRELRAFEDIFKVSNGPKITVENTLDNAACPPGFEYISDCIYGEGVQKPDAAFSTSCECGPGQCEVEKGCMCMIEAKELNDFDILPYDTDGRVKERASKLLWECHAGCGCGPGCISRSSQRGRQFALKIKRFPVKGWGVVLDQEEPIPPRSFVARYAGEIILNQEAERRGRRYDEEGATWLFDLDYTNENEEVKYSIDAYRKGNESHFFNHSCDPNLSVYMLVGGGTAGDSDIMTLSFWSNRWIYKGEELTFDYNGKFIQSWLVHDKDGEEADEDDKSGRKRKNGTGDSRQSKEGLTPCMCGAKTCRKWVHL